MNNFKNRLNELLKEKNISKQELLNKIGIENKFIIFKWLHGEIMPNLSKAIDIANVLNCSLEYLFGFTNLDSEQIFKTTKSFDLQLKEILKTHKTSQYKLIKNGICSPGNFTDWFKNKATPSMSSIFKLKNYFNLTIDELVGRI